MIITSLAAKFYDTTSAATTAMFMLHFFLYIRVELIIKIDAEIARSKRDRNIRLSDVVICQSDEKNDEVLQYDFRKTKIEDKLKFKSFFAICHY